MRAPLKESEVPFQMRHDDTESTLNSLQVLVVADRKPISGQTQFD